MERASSIPRSALGPSANQAHAERAKKHEGHCNDAAIATQCLPAMFAQEVLGQKVD